MVNPAEDFLTRLITLVDSVNPRFRRLERQESGLPTHHLHLIEAVGAFLELVVGSSNQFYSNPTAEQIQIISSAIADFIEDFGFPLIPDVPILTADELGAFTAYLHQLGTVICERIANTDNIQTPPFTTRSPLALNEALSVSAAIRALVLSFVGAKHHYSSCIGSAVAGSASTAAPADDLEQPSGGCAAAAPSSAPPQCLAGFLDSQAGSGTSLYPACAAPAAVLSLSAEATSPSSPSSHTSLSILPSHSSAPAAVAALTTSSEANPLAENPLAENAFFLNTTNGLLVWSIPQLTTSAPQALNTSAELPAEERAEAGDLGSLFAIAGKSSPGESEG